MSELSHEPVLQQFPDAEWDEAAGAVIVPLGQARTVAEWLLGQGVDYCSNVTGVDYLEREVKEKITNDAGEVETVTRTEPGRIDVVYHLYSMQNKTGPLVLKQRTGRDNAGAESLVGYIHDRRAELRGESSEDDGNSPVTSDSASE